MTSPIGLPVLSPAELQRYSRHLILPQVERSGQQRLKAARVLVIGAGGLGSPVALYLAAAGIGTLGLVDFDVVDVSNLQRQLLHGTSDVGRLKLDSARDRLHDVNPHVHVETYPTRLTSANALEIIGDYDIVVDGTDNFATRYLTNDACVLLGKPNVYGSIFRFEGQASVFSTVGGPCYRCLFPEPPPPGMVPSCAEGGVLGVLPGMIGTIQAAETLKLALGTGTTLAGRLLLVDALTMEFRTVKLRKDPACPACGTRVITELIDYDEFCGSADVAMIDGSDEVREITPTELASLLLDGADVDLIDVREPREWEFAHLAGARLIPLGTLGDALPTLDRSRQIVVMCRSGQRSASAVLQLQAAGFARVKNLAGGILRWSDDVDPTVPKY
ncbi:MAG: molybdopterin-synthase adenylyltransferase MoeB [Gemmatimonadaceae bacterium]|nr:molybdopterin-synthase adenylyltransferase MoeB [Gemmatimonadaceae bacterium]